MPDKKKSNNVMHIINICLCAVVFFGIAVFLIIAKRPEVSETEKRKLAEFPEFSAGSLFSGEYTAGIRSWYDDSVPGRDMWKDAGSSVLELTGVRAGEVKFYGDKLTKYDGETFNTPETEIEVETGSADTSESGEARTEALTEAQTEAVTEEKINKEDLPEEGEDGMISNNILVYRKRAIMLYGGSLANAERYSGYVNNYKRDLGDGVNVYSMTIPTSVAYYLPDQYKDYTRDQKTDIEHMTSFYDKVENIDVYGTLLKHTDENIYLRTDHHWQPLGAYYAAEEFCRQLGLPFADLSEYEKIEVEGYVGSMYGYTGDAVLLNNPETFIYYKPQNDYECWYRELDLSNPQKSKLFWKTSVNGSYCAFLGTDRTVAQLRTSNKNGRKLAIIKDSYGNALVPFLTGSFEEVWVIDMRYFESNTIKFIKDYGITDVLFASCMFSACGGNAKFIEYLRTFEPETEAVTEEVTETEAVTEPVSESGEEKLTETERALTEEAVPDTGPEDETDDSAETGQATEAVGD